MSANIQLLTLVAKGKCIIFQMIADKVYLNDITSRQTLLHFIPANYSCYKGTPADNQCAV